MRAIFAIEMTENKALTTIRIQTTGLAQVSESECAMDKLAQLALTKHS